jgi:Raf kinase inhibitor-like YbhB/YbcL family protein
MEITSSDFEEGGEIPKECGYKFENKEPDINIADTQGITLALIMDDPDAMAAVGKVWVHWLQYWEIIGGDRKLIDGKTDFGEIGYGGPAPPDGRHTYIFKSYDLDIRLDLKEGYSKQELEDAMKGHIISEAKLTGTFAS